MEIKKAPSFRLALRGLINISNQLYHGGMS